MAAIVPIHDGVDSAVRGGPHACIRTRSYIRGRASVMVNAVTTVVLQ